MYDCTSSSSDTCMTMYDCTSDTCMTMYDWTSGLHKLSQTVIRPFYLHWRKQASMSCAVNLTILKTNKNKYKTPKPLHYASGPSLSPRVAHRLWPLSVLRHTSALSTRKNGSAAFCRAIQNHLPEFPRTKQKKTAKNNKTFMFPGSLGPLCLSEQARRCD